MKQKGWLVFNFEALPENQRPRVKVRSSTSKKSAKVHCDVPMKEKVRVSQFDTLYIERESKVAELFPLRVTFLADPTKNVVARCMENQSLTSKQQFKLWMQG